MFKTLNKMKKIMAVVIALCFALFMGLLFSTKEDPDTVCEEESETDN